MSSKLAEFVRTVIAPRSGAGNGQSGHGDGGKRGLAGTPVVLKKIRITPRTSTFHEGESVQYVATGLYSDHSEKVLTTSVDWDSSPHEVVHVARTGRHGGRGPGIASMNGAGHGTVTATDPTTQKSDTITITVKPPKLAPEQGAGGKGGLAGKPVVLEMIEITPRTTTYHAGESVQYVATGWYSDHSKKILTTSVDWASSPHEVVHVARTGRHGGRGPGFASMNGAGNGTVTATDPTTLIPGSIAITVKPAPVLTQIKITPRTSRFERGESVQYIATGLYGKHSKKEVTDSVDWSSSNDAVVEVAKTGKASGVRPGFASMNGLGPATVTAKDPSSEVADSIPVTVDLPKLKSIEIIPREDRFAQLKTQQFKALATNMRGPAGDWTHAVTWKSSNTKVVSFEKDRSKDGLATLHKAGTVTITATEPESRVSDSLTFDVGYPGTTARQVDVQIHMKDFRGYDVRDGVVVKDGIVNTGIGVAYFISETHYGVIGLPDVFLMNQGTVRIEFPNTPEVSARGVTYDLRPESELLMFMATQEVKTDERHAPTLRQAITELGFPEDYALENFDWKQFKITGSNPPEFRWELTFGGQYNLVQVNK